MRPFRRSWVGKGGRHMVGLYVLHGLANEVLSLEVWVAATPPLSHTHRAARPLSAQNKGFGPQ
jgi:hypothetical protein